MRSGLLLVYPGGACHYAFPGTRNGVQGGTSVRGPLWALHRIGGCAGCTSLCPAELPASAVSWLGRDRRAAMMAGESTGPELGGDRCGGPLRVACGSSTRPVSSPTYTAQEVSTNTAKPAGTGTGSSAMPSPSATAMPTPTPSPTPVPTPLPVPEGVISIMLLGGDRLPGHIGAW